MFKNKYVESVFENLKKKNAGEAECLQAAQEILESLEVFKMPDGRILLVEY